MYGGAVPGMRKSVMALMLLMLLAVQPAAAHPHLFIKPGVGFVVAKGSVTALKIRWVWDEWWSEDVMAECDIDMNGKLDAKEIKLVKSDFFDGVERFNYFLRVMAGGKRVKLGKAKDFTAKIQANGIVTYEFTLPVQIALQPNSKIEICFIDDTIYTAFDGTVSVIGESKFIKKRACSPYGDYGVRLTLSP